MTEISPAQFIEAKYNTCIELVGSGIKITHNLSNEEVEFLDTFLIDAEKRKGGLTVLLTSIIYKCINPQQDIRYHQAGMEGGYSGRRFDTLYVTPFLKEKKFPAMQESGWLTRSFEQSSPYTLDYKGQITPGGLKTSFLRLIDWISSEQGKAEQYLEYLFQGLIINRNAQTISLAKPINLTIDRILALLDRHFTSKYRSEGAARLPVLAIYAVYECILQEIKRYDNMELLPLESHTSADARSGRIGDIDIVFDQKPFEAIEVKSGIQLTADHLRNAFEKFLTTGVNRYYLLSTAGVKPSEVQLINREIDRIKNIHGCQVIVNGIMSTLTYYLRLIKDPADFIERYVLLLESDKALKFEHKTRWNEIVAE